MKNDEVYLCFHDGPEDLMTDYSMTDDFGEEGLNKCRWATGPTQRFQDTTKGHFKHRGVAIAPSKSKLA